MTKKQKLELTRIGKEDRLQQVLTAQIEGKLAQNTSLQPLFTIRWTLA